jgi:hypothetical protein
VDVEKRAKGVAMSDVALAADRIRRVAGPRGHDDPIKVLMERAFTALRKYERKLREEPKWTRRRVRAIWRQEATRIDYREIAEMEAVISQARERHAAYIEESEKIRAYAASLLASLEAGDADFHSGNIEGLREVLRGVDSPRAGGGAE